MPSDDPREQPRHEWTVEPAESGARLDHFVAARGGLSHAAARRVLDEGRTRLAGRRGRKGDRVVQGQRVVVEGVLPDAAALRPLPTPQQPLDVLLVDEELVVINKPAGIPSHPLRAAELHTAVNALVARFPECAGAGDDPREGGLVQRLDTDTSGVLLAARSRSSWLALREALRSGRAEKEYLALVTGTIDRDGEVELALLHAPGDARRVLCVPEDTPEARPARTRYRPIATHAGCTLVRCLTSTGRMHQVRAHLGHLGHPIVGDALYGGPPADAAAPGHFLHAERLRLPHPRGTWLDVQAPLPADRRALLEALGFSTAGLAPAPPSGIVEAP